jgi:hypothetical protein
LFPDAVFIGIVRHPGGTVSSLVTRFRYGLRRAIRHWVRTNKRLVHEAVTHPERFALVRYEDLVDDPEAMMRALLDWLGEPWCAAVLAHHEVQPKSGAPRVVEGHTRSDAPIDADRPGRWTSVLDEEARSLLRQRAEPLARFLGYDVDDAAVREPLAADAGRSPGRLISGHDLIQRQRTHGADIDWTVVPQPGLDNDLLKPPAPRRRPGRPPVIRAGGGGPEPPSVARRLVDRLPWQLHRRVHDFRHDRERARPSRGKRGWRT